MWTMFKNKDEWLATTRGSLGMLQSARLQRLGAFELQEEGPVQCVIYFTNICNNEETFRIKYTANGWTFPDAPSADPAFPRAYLEGDFIITSFGTYEQPLG